MAVFQIVQYPDPILREKAREVQKITPQIERLAVNLVDTMRQSGGVGLAAPQIGVSKRVIVVEDPEKNPIVLINPEIVKLEGDKETAEEGCLSVPGVWGQVERRMCLTVRGYNLEGKQVAYLVEGFTARAFQHEIDHLDGIVFLDRATTIYKRKE
ncbi:MAG: peptide deformylase [Bacillota bacterium]